MPEVTVKDLKHLFDVLERVLPDLTNREPPNTPIFQDQSPPGPDMVRLKQLLVKLTHDEYSSVELSMAAKPAQSCSAGNDHEKDVHIPCGIDLKHPICTTQGDFKSFEKWASTPSFKKVVERYRPSSPIKSSSLTFPQKMADGVIAGTQKLASTRSPSRWRPTVGMMTMLNMHSLSVNVWVHNIFA